MRSAVDVLVMASVAGLALAACARPAEGEGEGEGEGEPPYLEQLDEAGDVASLSDAAIKFVAPVAGVTPREPVGDRCLFQNMRQQQFHLPFLNSLPGGADLNIDDYVELVLRRDTRTWWGGEARFLEAQPHPLRSDAGTFAWSLYTEDTPGNRLVIDDVRAVYAIMQRCAPLYAERLAFVPSSNEQRLTATSLRETLAAEGIAVILP